MSTSSHSALDPSIDEVRQAARDLMRRSGGPAAASPNRSEYAAALLAALAERCPPGSHLGTKVDLRVLCEVSVGTFNEAVKLAHSRGYVTSRSGPGGGIFVAERSAMVRLGNSVLALDGDATSVAEAVRMRNALDPLLVEDALWHASAADHAALRTCLNEMARAITEDDATAFLRSNLRLHARIAEVSPHAILRSVYLGLLELIESHTVAVRPSAQTSLPDYIASRHDLHVRLVDAIERRDRELALRLMAEHNTSSEASGPPR